jgi:hypothetical protein
MTLNVSASWLRQHQIGALESVITVMTAKSQTKHTLAPSLYRQDCRCSHTMCTRQTLVPPEADWQPGQTSVDCRVLLGFLRVNVNERSLPQCECSLLVGNATLVVANVYTCC